ncbi:MFS transporter [Apiospora rasikravindrae]|uniref:MFS transporter n=1 Tax=Apiospora rasikravindrae TaxID=990691 RepID=A0ABR1TEI5_9PEZI
MSVAQRRAAPESVDLGLRGAPVETSQTANQRSSSPAHTSAKWRTISYDAFGGKESGYTHFPDPTSIAAYNSSTYLRAAQVGFAVFVCAVASGIVCGFAALKPVLIAEGVYSDLCPADWGHHGSGEPCAAQDMRLNLFFILASVTLNVSTIFAGFTLDKRGRRTCYLIAAAVLAVGSLLMAAAFAKKIPPWLDGYLVGNLLLGLGGTYIFVPSFQLANAFPRYTGVVMALVTGAFDASAAVFLFYRMAYEGSAGRLKPQHFFLAYLVVPVLIVLAEMTFMPRFAYQNMPQIQDRLDRAKTSRYDAHSSDDELDTDAQRREARAGRAQARHAKVKRIETVTGGSRERRRREDRLERRQGVSGVWGMLHGLPVSRQMATPWFVLVLVLTMLQMLRMNYFIATLRAQYQYMLGGSGDDARRINEFFDVALPVAGVTVILAVLSALIVVLGVLNCLPYVWAGYLTVIAFVLFRPLYYSTMSDYVTKVFGFATFGRIYGTITCASGLSNIIQPGLDALTHGSLDGNPVPINVFFAASGTIVSASLVLYVYYQSRAFRHRQQTQSEDGSGGERAALISRQRRGRGGAPPAVIHEGYGTSAV